MQQCLAHLLGCLAAASDGRMLYLAGKCDAVVYCLAGGKDQVARIGNASIDCDSTIAIG